MLSQSTRAFITAAALFAATFAFADQVVLVNGDVLEGEVIEKTSTFITLQTSGTTLKLPVQRVKEIRASAPGAMELLRAREALSRANIAEARSLVEQAATKGASEEALREITEAIDKAQRDAELARYSKLIETARAAAATGQQSESLSEIRKVLDLLPADSPSRKELIDILVDYHLRRAEDHSDKVRTQLAMNELRQAIELDPRRADAYLDLADLFKNSSTTHDQAINYFTRAIECGKDILKPREMTRAYWELGEIYRQQKKWREAASVYREVFRRDPEFNLHLRDRVVEACGSFARDLQKASPQVALRVADEAIAVRSDTDLLMLKAELLHRLERHDESIAVVKEVLHAEPRTRLANFIIAQNLLALNEILEAREYLQREVTVHPGNFDALIALGDLALQRDDYANAQAYYGQAQALEPDNPKASLGLGKAYRLMEELDKAKTAVQEVLARFPEDREANLEMGRILVAEEKLDDARTFFTNVLDLIDAAPPEERETLKTLQADALIARGEIALLTAGPGTANKDFRKAIDVLPDYGQAYYSIGLAYRKKFASSKEVTDLKTAEENLLRSRELAPENPQFALQLGILYSQDLAQADAENRKQYLDKAVANWRSYIDLGGANTNQVKQWIDEISRGTTEQAKVDG